MGLNLTNEIFEHGPICDALVAAVHQKDAQIRVLISDPTAASEITAQRCREPGEVAHGALFLGLLEAAQEHLLQSIFRRLEQNEQDKLTIEVADQSVIYCMIIRIDDWMVVGNYLSGVQGNDTPGMIIRKAGDDSLFATYSAEFESAWINGSEFDIVKRKKKPKKPTV